MENTKKIKLDIKFDDKFNQEQDNYLIGHNKDYSKYYLARKIDESTKEIIEDTNNIIFYNLLEIEDSKYEVIEMLNTNGNEFSMLLLKALADLNVDLPSAIKKIEKVLKNIFDNVDIFKVRGTFGELIALKQFALVPQEGEYSVYDFISNSGNDVEVKTYSKIQNEVQISLQQLSNNKEAIFYFIELLETENEDGESLLDLAKSVNAEKYKRYDWIFSSRSKLIHKKFISKNWCKTTANDLSEGITLNDKVKNAKFIFEPKDFK